MLSSLCSPHTLSVSLRTYTSNFLSDMEYVIRKLFKMLNIEIQINYRGVYSLIYSRFIVVFQKEEPNCMRKLETQKKIIRFFSFVLYINIYWNGSYSESFLFDNDHMELLWKSNAQKQKHFLFALILYRSYIHSTNNIL